MERVNIYIKTSLKWPAQKPAAGMWIIEHVEDNRRPEAKDWSIYREKIRENELTLQCIVNAFFLLSRSKVKTGSVTVFTECEHVLNVMNNHWLPIWKKNGWRNAKEKMVSNMLLWTRLADLMEPYAVSFTGESHNYSDYMQLRVEKEIERRKDEQSI